MVNNHLKNQAPQQKQKQRRSIFRNFGQGKTKMNALATRKVVKSVVVVEEDDTADPVDCTLDSAFVVKSPASLGVYTTRPDLDFVVLVSQKKLTKKCCVSKIAYEWTIDEVDLTKVSSVVPIPIPDDLPLTGVIGLGDMDVFEPLFAIKVNKVGTVAFKIMINIKVTITCKACNPVVRNYAFVWTAGGADPV